MADEQTPVSDQVEVQPPVESDLQKGESSEQYVARKAYEDVSKDMHKYKSRTKEANARANELEAKLKAIEEDKLREQENFKELYERANKEREDALVEKRNAEQRYVDTAKRAALKSELGGVNDRYLVHANLSAIEVNEDGSLNSESVQSVANQFREEHSVLLPKADGGNVTSSAPARAVAQSGPKTLDQMTTDEKIAELAKFNNRS